MPPAQNECCIWSSTSYLDCGSPLWVEQNSVWRDQIAILHDLVPPHSFLLYSVICSCCLIWTFFQLWVLCYSMFVSELLVICSSLKVVVFPDGVEKIVLGDKKEVRYLDLWLFMWVCLVFKNKNCRVSDGCEHFKKEADMSKMPQWNDSNNL